MTSRYGQNLIETDFFSAWQKIGPVIREKKAHSSYTCNSCEKRILCGFCPPFFDLENGSEEEPSKYLCEIGHLRFDLITNNETASISTAYLDR